MLAVSSAVRSTEVFAVHRLLLAVPLLLAACDPGCDAAMTLSSGAVAGSLDGVPWSAERATWRVAETGAQVVSPPSEGWRLTLVAQTTDTGRDAAVRVRRGGLPIDVMLGSGADGGWALLNPNSGNTHTTTLEGGGGWLRLARRGGGDLYGCAAFTVIENRDGRRGDTMDVDLSFRATRE